MGPMTGRGAGFCGGYDAPGYASGPGYGRGFFGRGRGVGGRGGWFGGGRGHRHWFYATGIPGWFRGGWATPWSEATPDAEKQYLRSEVEAMEAELAAARRRLSTLDRSTDKPEASS